MLFLPVFENAKKLTSLTYKLNACTVFKLISVAVRVLITTTHC